MTDEPELSADEIEAFQRDAVLVDPGQASANEYPRLFNLSAGILYRAVIRADVPKPPEYVTVTSPPSTASKLSVAISQWNLLWEAAQFRRRFFDEEDLPAELRNIEVHGTIHTMATPGEQPSQQQLTATVIDFLTTTLR